MFFISAMIALSGISIPGGSCNDYYIIPINSSNSSCPINQSCVTLDNFAMSQLPNLKGANSVTLIFLSGTHTLTQSMNFVDINLVVMNGERDQHKVLIQLQLGNIMVSKPSRLEIRNLGIYGSGQQTLMVKNSPGGQFTMNQVTMLATALQILDDNCDVSIQSCHFKASMIEIRLSGQSRQSRSVITDSTFLSGEQSYTIAVCNPSTQNRKVSLGLFSQTYLGLNNVTILDLNEITLRSYPLPSLCKNITRHSPTDIYIAASYAQFEINNSHFNRSYGTAIQALACTSSQFAINNCSFSDYTQGVLLFTDDLDGAVITLYNTTMTNNSINAGSIAATGAATGIATAVLTVYPYEPFNVSTQVEVAHCTFKENADNVGNLQIILIHALNKVNIKNSKFTHNKGTVIGADESVITFSGEITFEGNVAHDGGALALTSTYINIADRTTVNFRFNAATQFGGAIFIDDPLFYLQNDYSTRANCFYQPLLRFDFANMHVALNFYNNSATSGGDHIYGTGTKNYCKARSFQLEPDELHKWHSILHILDEQDASFSKVSSKPMRVCLCDKHGQPQCADELKVFSATIYNPYPGEPFNVSLVVVGAEFGTTIGSVYAKLLHVPLNTSSIHNTAFGNENEAMQLLHSNDHCINLTYSVWSSNSCEIIYLTTTNVTVKYYGDTKEIRNAIQEYKTSNVIPLSLLTTPVFINVTLRPCPLGFTMAKQSYCDCYSELKRHDIKCILRGRKGYISREGNNWIGVDENDTNNSSIIFNNHCPFDYCYSSQVPVDLETDPDVQCSNNHSGTLCGGCKEDYSVAIGSSHCLYCPSNNNLALLIFFLTAGPILYILIAAFNLTITKGAINGLLFYANIVWIYQNILFPTTEDITNRSYLPVVHILKIFMAWLNLDFGIETCFVKGLNGFWKSMLQYAFPIYIWIIAGMIITLYRCVNMQHFQRHCQHLANLLENPVDVLVTFILLSYTKLVRTISDAFGFAILTAYPHNTTKIVWALDGNIEYLKGKHAASFTIATLVLIATLIYTTYILFMGLKIYLCECKRAEFQEDDQEQRVDDQNITQRQEDHQEKKRSNLRCRVCYFKEILNYLDMPLPLYNAHFAPLDSKHKYWLGLTLFVRIALLLVFTTLFELEPSLNLPVLYTTATLLLFHMAWNNIYRNKSLRLLESLSLSNLIFLSGGVQYANHKCSQTWKSAIVSISIGITLIQFLGIVGYRFIQCCIKKKKQKISVQSNQDEIVPISDDNHVSLPGEEQAHSNRFRESLLDEGSENNERQPFVAHPPPEESVFQCLRCCH